METEMEMPGPPPPVRALHARRAAQNGWMQPESVPVPARDEDGGARVAAWLALPGRLGLGLGLGLRGRPRVVVAAAVLLGLAVALLVFMLWRGGPAAAALAAAAPAAASAPGGAASVAAGAAAASPVSPVSPVASAPGAESAEAVASAAPAASPQPGRIELQPLVSRLGEDERRALREDARARRGPPPVPRAWALVTPPLERARAARAAAQLQAVALLRGLPTRVEQWPAGTRWRAVSFAFASAEEAEKVRLALRDKGLPIEVLEF